jgi:hypothetical protein
MADGDQWPYKGAVSLVRGDPGNRDNWTSFRYGESPLPHWQVGKAHFDSAGRLWISALSAGCAVLTIREGVPGDLDGDGDVDQADLAILLADWGCTGGDCPGDADGDGDTDQADLAVLLAHFGT